MWHVGLAEDVARRGLISGDCPVALGLAGQSSGSSGSRVRGTTL